jgi:heterodisulfide reductase subunit A-like polyferredoxin
MIQCVGSSQQASPYCSRVCCSAAIKNALKTLQLNPKAKMYILYRDLRPNGLEEEYLAEAREKGVTFLPWSESPQLTVEEDGGVDLRAQEAGRAEEVRLRPDLVVLSTAALPQPDSEALGTILGVERNTHGFFQEKDGADRPLELSREGIYVCGWARHPAGLAECLCQAGSVAVKVAHFLRKDGSWASG